MPVTLNGWTILAHPQLISQLEKLVDAVEKIAKADPGAVAASPNGKLLAAITQLIFTDIPSNPEDKKYRQGKTLGEGRKHWFRAKFGNGRFRLFFRYSTKAKIIIFAWVNDEESLRTRGAKTDAYEVFKSMLKMGDPPDKWETLLQQSQDSTQLGELQTKALKL